MSLEGTVQVPGSKSITHRALILGARSAVHCNIVNGLQAADTDATRNCLDALGCNRQGDSFKFAKLGGPAKLDCKNSGTTLRLLAGQAATFGEPIDFVGDESLSRRPNAPLLRALQEAGVVVQGDNMAPFRIQGPMKSHVHHLPAQISSQFVSSIMLAAPFLSGDTHIDLAPPVSSKPYIDLTIQVAAAFGLQIEQQENQYTIPGGQRTSSKEFHVEADWSTAAFPLVAGALAGDVTVSGLQLNSLQGDRAIVDILRSFGCHVRQNAGGVRVQQANLISPGTIDVEATPDLFPILTVLAAVANGTTTFTGAAALRYKESDRIAAMAAALGQMGITVQEAPDGLTVTGGSLHGATVDSHGDHRVHMACTIAGLIADGQVNVSHPECAAVSYPNFHADLARLVAQ